MSSITTIQAADLITNSRSDINNNFANLNADKMETSVLDTDTTLAANSDAKVATQKAVKAYVDAGGNARQFSFRTNGDGNNYLSTGTNAANAGNIAASGYAQFIVLTDSGGIVEWAISSGGGGTTTVDVVAYW